MTDQTIMTLLGFAAAVIAIAAPFFNATNKLNATIARLNEALENLEENWKAGQASLEGRVDTHGRQIDELEKTTATHDVRIKNLEDKS